MALVTAAVLALWLTMGKDLGRIGFYLAFALSVTASVQLVGVYLVFASLIVPALAVRRLEKEALPAAYLVGAVGYGLGLSASAVLDLPSGPVVVWTLAVCAVAVTCVPIHNRAAKAERRRAPG
jgi:zinc/manganese transport system permease protein